MTYICDLYIRSPKAGRTTSHAAVSLCKTSANCWSFINNVHIAGYQSILQRLSSTATLTSLTSGGQHEATPSDMSQFELSLNHDVVRTLVLAPAMTLRLGQLHQFLAEHLAVYSSCLAVYPPQWLYPTHPGTSMPVICKSYGDNRVVPLDAQPDTTEPAPKLSPYRPDDRPVTSPADPEFCLQWYQPCLQEATLPPPGEESRVGQLLLFSAGSGKRGSGVSANMTWVSMPRLLDLHDRYILAHA